MTRPIRLTTKFTPLGRRLWRHLEDKRLKQRDDSVMRHLVNGRCQLGTTMKLIRTGPNLTPMP